MESQRKTSRSLILCCLLSLLAAAAWSQPASKPSDGLSRWNDRLQAARADLIAGRHRKALDTTRALQAEMVNRISSGSGAGKALALTTLSRSLAEAGLGEMEAAEWDWYVAKALDPTVTTLDLTAFGAAGSSLKSFGTGNRIERQESSEVKDPGRICDSKKETCVQKPELVKRSDLSYPDALQAACAEGTVLVESIIDEEGKIRYPHLMDSPGGPVMAFAALESLRSWRFKPATFEGRPVKVYYTLTVNFRATSKNCLERKS